MIIACKVIRLEDSCEQFLVGVSAVCSASVEMVGVRWVWSLVSRPDRYHPQISPSSTLHHLPPAATTSPHLRSRPELKLAETGLAWTVITQTEVR